LLDVYLALDNALGTILAAINLAETTVIIFALHGMGANLSQEHFVTPLMDRVNAKFGELEPGLFPAGHAPRQRSVMRLLRENIPPWLQSKIAPLVLSTSEMRSSIANLLPAVTGRILPGSLSEPITTAT